MQRGLEQALDRAEEVIARARQRPPERRAPSGEEKSLHEKLYDIYVEECGREPEDPEELTTSSNLLEKLVSRESLPCLVFSLYPGDKGYSVMLDDKSGSFSETISLPYGESKLLEYLDAQQLPPVLLDLLSTSQMNLFHSGCVIAEIRDYRQCGGLDSPVYKSRHILLRPTMQTLVCDVEAIASDNPPWTQQDKLTLESQLILATAEPLCLDPSVAVACTADRLLFNMQTMNAAPMVQSFKRHSWPSVSLQEESFSSTSHPDSRVLTACEKRKEKKSSQEEDLKITTQNYVDKWKQRPCDLNLPSEIDVDKYATGNQPGNASPTFCSSPVIENDFVFDYEAESHLWETKRDILMSNNDPLWCDIVDPPNYPLLKRLRQAPHASTGDQSGGLQPKSKTDAGMEVSTCQASVKSTAEYAGEMASGPSISASVSQPSPQAKPRQPMTSVSSEPSVSGNAVNSGAPWVTSTSTSGQSFSGQDPAARRAYSSRKLPPLAPAPKPRKVSQKCPVYIKGDSSLPPQAQPSASHSQNTAVTKNRTSSTSLKIIHVVGPARGSQGLVSASHSVLSSPTDAPGARVTQPSGLQPSERQRPNSGLSGTQPPSQPGMQITLHNPSGLMPLTILQLSPGSIILSTQPQPQAQTQTQIQQLQLQLLPQAHPPPPQHPQVFQLIPQQQLQQPTTSVPPQHGPQASAKRPSSRQRTLPAQQNVVINLSGEGHFQKPQAAVLGQRGSGQQRPRQSPTPQGFQAPPALQQQVQAHGQVQSHQVKYWQCPVSVATRSTQTISIPQHDHTAHQDKDSTNKDLPPTPKS
ncbi:transcription factor SPT20 homolog [Fukomys damarensis]|uniref:Protein FAM48A n=1 Tax=Fukomys damarensis TaxID=885580 RepID=A0A091CV12_FUKDA|nr:transcription factor SPT20 homolog [Fukomys damarensis]XP_033616448.1 transcription factor SPT20 homolog [Fukomys damarensis]KFO22352.1 Protein FAM48A [Fukomys damarensis]